MNGLAEGDGWASHSSVQPSAPANKDAGACPTFFVRGERMWLRTVARGILSCGAQRAAVLTDGEWGEAWRKSAKRENDGGNLRIWVFHVDYPFFSWVFFVTEKGCYAAVNIRCVCICVCVCTAHQGSLMMFGSRLIMLSKDSELL